MISIYQSESLNLSLTDLAYVSDDDMAEVFTTFRVQTPDGAQPSSVALRARLRRVRDAALQAQA